MKRFLVPLLPLVAGILAVVLRQAGLLPRPVVYLRAELAGLLLVAGAFASLLWLLARALYRANRRAFQRTLSAYERQQSDAHHRFVRRLDHEVKNPLTAIRAGLANLSAQQDAAARQPGPAVQGTPALQGQGPSAVQGVRVQVDRLVRLTSDLRKLADLETQPIETEPVRLDQLLADLYETACQRADVADRQLHLAVPTAPWPLPPVAGDADLLFLVIHNLLDNAIKFTRPDDTIELRASEDGASVAVEVADTGPGIPEDELPHVGEELYRGSTAGSVEGSGLGLALARAIAERHGGTLIVRSRAGQGTVVTLRLPAAH